MATYFEQAAELRSPTSRDFDPDAWIGLIESIDGSTPEERAHCATALAFGRQLKPMRDARDRLLVTKLRPTDAVTLVCGAINAIGANTLDLSSRGYDRPDASVVSPTAMFHNPMVIEGKEVPPVDALIERLVDGGVRWLFDAAHSSGTAHANAAIPSVPQWLGESEFYVLETQLRLFAHQFEYAGWRLIESDDGDLFAPRDEGVELFLDAVRLRQESIRAAVTSEAIGRWRTPVNTWLRSNAAKGLRTVEAIPTTGAPRWRVVDVSTDAANVPASLVREELFANSYVAPLMDEPMPSHPGVTLRLILRAWSVLEAMVSALPDVPLHEAKLPDLRRFACCLSWRRLRSLLTKTLAIEGSVAEEVISLLTIEFGHSYKFDDRGLWSAPIVRVPDTSDVCLVAPALRTGNVLWIVDAWLAKGNVFDNTKGRSKGDVVEAHARASFLEAVRDNPLLTNSSVHHHGLKAKHYGEQIDALIKLGGTLLVVEIKTMAAPDEAFSQHMYDKKQAKGVDQVVRKAERARVRPDVTAKLFGIGEDEAKTLRILPVLASNHGPGRIAVLETDAIVTDTRFLRVFLEAGQFESGVAMNYATGRIVKRVERLYASEAEAERVVEDTLRRPPVLRRMMERLMPATYAWPVAASEPLFHVRAFRADETSKDAEVAARLLEVA